VPVQGDIPRLLNRVHMEGVALRGAHMWRFPATAQRGVERTVADAYRSPSRRVIAASSVCSGVSAHGVSTDGIMGCLM
jgi:hypothetical protein